MANPEFSVIKCQTSKRLECNHFCFAPDSRTILGCVSPNILARWDAETGKIIARVRVPRSSNSFALEYSPNGRQIALAGEGEIAVIDSASFKILKSVRFEDPAIYESLDWSPDGRRIVAGGGDLRAVCWHPDTGEATTSKQRDDNVGFAAFSANPSEILFCCGGEVFLWNPAKNQERRRLKLSDKDGYCWDHALSPDKSTLVSFSERGCFIRTDTKTWRSKRFKAVRSSCGFQFDFSRHGRLLVTTSDSDAIYVWDVEAGKQWFKWRQPRRLAAFSPTFSPDGQRLACSLDSELFVLKFGEDVESLLATESGLAGLISL